MHIPAELITKPQPPLVNSVDCSVQTQIYLQGFLYKRSNPWSHIFYDICGSVSIHKGSIHFLFLMENFKGCRLLPKHFQVQSNEAGCFLGTKHLPKAPSFLVNHRHLHRRGSCFCIHLWFLWELHKTVWLHWASLFSIVKRIQQNSPLHRALWRLNNNTHKASGSELVTE